MENNLRRPFVEVKGHPNYLINQDGVVISTKRKCIMIPEVLDNGYVRVPLNGKRYYIHRLVAEHFIPNSENKKYVVHINHNRSDNRVENLTWSNYYVYDHDNPPSMQ